jgi:UDP-GlcNAc:undecaprenyl-phosphate GlcNAc-1-phosphate transferase
MIMLAGLPVLDMTMVIISRLRRGVPVGKGGRDHITHRLRSRLGSARLVALALAIAQAALCLAAIEITGWSKGAVLVACGLAFALGAAAIAIFELPTFTAALPNRSRVPAGVPAADSPAASQRH